MTEIADPPIFNYLLLRNALNLYETTPFQLTANQWQQVAKQAQQQYALENKILATPEALAIIIPEPEVNTAVTTIKNRYSDEAAFLQDLEQNELDETSLQMALMRELKVEAILNKVANAAPPVTDAEINDYYQQNPHKFQRPEVRAVRHILLTINEDYTENRRSTAYQRLTQIQTALQSQPITPERFADQAQRHSECPSAMEGGWLGRLPRGQLYPELETQLFNLSANQLSDIIESPLGFHLLWCETIYPAGLVPFSEAYPQIKEALTQHRHRIQQKQWLAQLDSLKT